MKVSFDQTVVLITGASKGIGLACARAFAQAGARVVGVSRSQKNLDAAVAELAAEGLVMQAMAADLGDAQAAAGIVQRVEQEVGPIGVLVNSAGAARRNAPDQLGPEAFHQAMDAKYFTYVYVQDAVAKLMAQRGRGSVVNIIGQGGKSATTFHIAGGSANAALMLTTVGYARAYASRGVRFNGINPGLTQTTRVEEGLQVAAKSSGRTRDEVLAEELTGIPMGRLGKPEEVANVALFLASDLASYVSGVLVPMDGCATTVI
jgi:NAD(P)-dependent dehydrogenase (short-subunit alcohol dehydrogenase family)